MQLFSLKNNNRFIGIVKGNSKNLKKYMAIATLGFVVLTTAQCHSEKRIQNEPVLTADMAYSSSHEARYNNIEYEVQWGDSLTKIVAAYENDYNLILRYVDEIERDNKINGILKQGEVIRLWGVPESMLVDYGYTADYSIIGYDVMVKDAYEWLEEERKNIIETEYNRENIEQFNKDYAKFELAYGAFLTQDEGNEKQQKLDDLVELVNDLVIEFKKITGLNFEYHHQAYPIPQENVYENVL